MLRIVRWFTAAVLVGAAVTMSVPAPAQAQPQVIKLATLVPDGSIWDKGLRDMGSQWTSSTQGRVTLKVYPGGIAGDEPDLVRKMRIGQLQAAAITTAGLASIDPSFQLFNIPMFFDSYPELDAVLAKLTPILKARLEAKGFILLGWGHGGWVYFFTKNPVKNVDDLKKTKLFAWAGDQPMIDRWKSNGYQPVPLAATDILTALQTNMIDTYPTTPLLGLTLQWYKQTPYMVGVGLAPLVGGLVMSKQAWNKLSEDDQERIILGSKRLEMRLHADVPKQDTTAIGEMQKRGLKVMTVSPAELAQYRATAQAFAVTMRGSAVPSDILDIATRERDAYRQSRGAKR